MDCEKEGYLTKMGQVAKNWKLRYFVLRDGILCYYKTQTHAQTSGKPLGLLYLGETLFSRLIVCADVWV